MITNYAVITADVIGSRDYEDFDNRFYNRIKEMDSDCLLTPFKISRGDEIQAICNEVYCIPMVLRHLRYRCHPFALRIAVGIGEIKNVEKTENSWDKNGPLFNKVRDILEEIKDEDKPLTRFITEDENMNIYLNTIYSLIDKIMDNWSIKQWEAIQLYYKNKNLKKVGKLLNITYQSTHERIQRSNWNTIDYCEKNISLLLKKEFM
ncbi:SatD family protein [Clostridiisalibacter paucivorans]|uniref:SatD family protein n=1 Tax=Clostridiisalibacter paucivorans TaxID=408753 RepID=UPI00047CB4DB|nr:SatD family protein [Clostridiisalibacter paucivorans]